MKRFTYARASTVEEAVQALDDGCRPLAGGTDLIGLMKRELTEPERLVGLRDIPNLRGIEETEEGWRLGALITLADLAAPEGVEVPQDLGLLSRAAAESATPQLRHAATLGGNLLQRSRCWYFRNPLIHCWLKGGGRCFAAKGQNEHHAILGGGPCYMVHPSDPAVALIALDARVELVGADGTRTVALEDFYRLPRTGGRKKTVVEPDELVTNVLVPRPPAGARSAYVKVAERASWDFALVSAAVQVALENGTVQEARVALGGVAPIPWRARGAEEVLVGRSLTADAVAEAAAAATAEARPLEKNGYKVDLVHGVLREALGRVGAEG
jgi:xanthine dehydrogenase YagS FAD-binding subunit